MMKALAKKFTLFFFLVLPSNLCFSQGESHWNCFSGTLYLSNGDSLTGGVFLYEISADNLLIDNYRVGFHSSIEHISAMVDTNYWKKDDLQVFTSDVEKDTMVKWIKIKEIKSVKIFVDKKKTYCIVYKNLYDNNTLWKSLKKNDYATIYNDLIFPVERYLGAAHHMILESNSEKIVIHSFWGWFFSNSRIDKLLVRFINKRYNKSFKVEDFKSIDEMFDYILTNK